MGDSVRWLDDDEQRAWRAFLKGIGLLFARLEAHLKEFGLTVDDYKVLTMLSEAPDDRLRLGEIADEIERSRSRLTYRLNGLEERGLLARRDDDADGRGVWAELTADGRAFVETIAPHHVEHVRSAMLDHFDRDTFLAMGDAFARTISASGDVSDRRTSRGGR